jgi:hypothetical protein
MLGMGGRRRDSYPCLVSTNGKEGFTVFASSLDPRPALRLAHLIIYNYTIPVTDNTADFTMPQERVGQRRKAPPRAGKVPGGAEGRFSLRKRSAERPWNFLNRDISPSLSVAV